MKSVTLSKTASLSDVSAAFKDPGIDCVIRRSQKFYRPRAGALKLVEFTSRGTNLDLAGFLARQDEQAARRAEERAEEREAEKTAEKAAEKSEKTSDSAPPPKARARTNKTEAPAKVGSVTFPTGGWTIKKVAADNQVSPAEVNQEIQRLKKLGENFVEVGKVEKEGRGRREIIWQIKAK